MLRIFPTVQQHKKLNKWFGTTRWTYNQCVHIYQTTGLSGLGDLRRCTVNRGCHLGKETEWVLDTPTEVRDEAVRDFTKALKINLKRKREHPEHQFQMKYKSVKRLDSDSIVLSKKKGPTERRLVEKMLSEEGPLRDKAWESDWRIVRKRGGLFYVVIPETSVKPSDNQADAFIQAGEAIALDPGVRTFLTGYTESGTVVEWGPDDVQRLCRLHAHYDKLWKQIRTTPGLKHRQRYRWKRAAARIRQKMGRLTDEMHRKAAKFLCENYSVILLPKFQTSQMVAKKRNGKRRRIGKRTVRGLLALKHYQFRQRLLDKAELYPHVKVFVVNEAWTSKTCSYCGWIDRKLGGKKVFTCQQCHRCIRRDVNGARGIMLRVAGMLSA